MADDRLASYRYRMQIPSRNIGYESVFSKTPVNADIHFFSKAFNPEELIMAESCSRVVYDLCDDWFIQNGREKRARDFCELADAVTCPTSQMADRIFTETGIKATVIGDPCEFTELPPKDQDELNVLWFGHSTNLNAVEFGRYKCNLEIVTSIRPKVFGNIKFTKWSMENMRLAFERNNVVIIPSKDHPSNYVKSPNRLVESLRSGLYVIASPLPSYREFNEYAELVLDIPSALEKRRDKNRVFNGQQYIRENYSPNVIGEKWNRLFSEIRYG